MNEQSENIRKKYLYRRLIMTKKVKLQRRAATGLVGPDCAYHLYSQVPTPNGQPEGESTTGNTDEA
ncbi:MAG: hypothetical protein AAF564_18425 [Bacteroidota bacterium]